MAEREFMGDMLENAMLLEEKAREARRLIIRLASRARSPHVGSALSCVDVLTALYFHKMRIEKSDWQNRDIFVLSKAHAAMSLYTMLYMRDIIDETTYWGYFQDGGTLPGHLDRERCLGVEVSAGSLGHGFNIAAGMAIGFQRRGEYRNVFTLIGDGESQEGSIWEGAMFASRWGLGNLTAILDYNNLQGFGRCRDLCQMEPVADKWKAFGWEAWEVNGHDFKGILEALDAATCGKPRILIARTVKGKGVSFMEDQLKWHYYMVTEALRDQALEELGGCNA